MNRRYPRYPDDADYQTNAPSYYEDLARKQKLIQLLSEKIWEYENTLDETLEQIEKRLTDYILENDLLMNERLENWDQRIDEMPDEMQSLFVTWLNDGTLEQIINHDVLGNKADQSELDKTNELLKQTVTNVRVSFEQFGGHPDNENNAQAFVDLAEFINNRGGFTTVVYPAGVYKYKPDFEESWRSLTELVDVKNVTIYGYGATIQQEKEIYWTAGSADINNNQESPMRFRSTTGGNCENITIYGLTMLGDRVPYNELTGDGNCMGFCFRGVHNIKLVNVSAHGWGTDGLYVGTTYGNTDKSKGLFVLNSHFHENTRQGASVTGCDDFSFSNCTFEDTHGGSFGHGLDLEPNGEHIQKRGSIIGCTFKNNERGSLNFIRTEDVIVSNNFMIELLNITNGTIYMDADSKNIDINHNMMENAKAVYYITGSGNISNVRFTNNTIKTMRIPYNSATVRINPQGNVENIQNISFEDNTFYGNGGLYVSMEGVFTFKRNKMFVEKPENAETRFAININSETVFVDNEIIIDENFILPNETVVYMSSGVVDGNVFRSHAKAKMHLLNRSTLEVGLNEFSEHFYYKEDDDRLNVTDKRYVHQITPFGRFVTGGFVRTTKGKNAKVNDFVVIDTHTAGSTILYKCSEAGSPGVWKRLLRVIDEQV